MSCALIKNSIKLWFNFVLARVQQITEGPGKEGGEYREEDNSSHSDAVTEETTDIFSSQPKQVTDTRILT